MTRNRLLIWAVLILLGINIATIVSALSYSGRMRADEKSRAEAMVDQRMLFFRDHLQLTEEQMKEFAGINRAFNQEARRTTSRLEMLRRNMVDELAGNEPDMQKIESITEEIGLLHRELKMSTANYYLNLKSACNPLQQELLKEMFMMMSDPESDMNDLRRGPMGPGPGGRGRNMRGMGRGMGPNIE
ncbi:MAG: periplasmic heavy metal sensor [Bacteroidales bacterium]|nr:periplasmic heavy metal sensor [Bacteroidales bacterium]